MLLASHLLLKVHSSLYVKDPETSELGKRILQGAISLIEDLGFDNFTFSKLGQEIGSTEASIYRYFENKNKLLLYLTNWYWAWMEYRLHFLTANINSPREKLRRAIQLINEEIEHDKNISHINEGALYKIIVNESAKVYLNKEVDEDNRKGAYLQYKRFVGQISDWVLDLNPDYKYPHMLISTTIEGAHFQRYFAEHLPRLTDVIKGENSITDFYLDLIFNAIRSEKE